MALEFHHYKGSKKFNIGKSIAVKSWSTVRKELKKCELLCSNCHRVEHADRSQEFLREVNGGCSSVG